MAGPGRSVPRPLVRRAFEERWTLQDAWTFAFYWGLGTAMQRVPEPVAREGALVISQALLPARRAAMAAYLENLEAVLGRRVRGEEARCWTRRVAAAYGRYWQEGARLPQIPGEVVDERLVVEDGFELLEQALRSDQGVILALPHLGSWEWGGAWLARRGFPMTAVVEALRPRALFEWFAAKRRAMGLEVLSLADDPGPALLRTLRSGGLVGLVSDRLVDGAGVPVELFGRPAVLPGGPATLALRTGAALFPAAVYQGPGPLHTGVVLPRLDTTRRAGLRADVARVTQELAGAFERLIRRAPDQWYAFQPLSADRGTRREGPAR
jgi:lauroyl/myristoyl acyltransferase